MARSHSYLSLTVAVLLGIGSTAFGHTGHRHAEYQVTVTETATTFLDISQYQQANEGSCFCPGLEMQYPFNQGSQQQKCTDEQCPPITTQSCDVEPTASTRPGRCQDSPESPCNADRPPLYPCDSNSDCSQGLVCDTTGRCQTYPEPECSFTSVCSSGFACTDSGSCQLANGARCVQNADCHQDQVCNDLGICQKLQPQEGCSRDRDCHGNTICNTSGLCISPSGRDCQSRTDCPDGQRCSSEKTCEPPEPPPECGATILCLDGYRCNTYGRCVSTKSSKTDPLRSTRPPQATKSRSEVIPNASPPGHTPGSTPANQPTPPTTTSEPAATTSIPSQDPAPTCQGDEDCLIGDVCDTDGACVAAASSSTMETPGDIQSVSTPTSAQPSSDPPQPGCTASSDCGSEICNGVGECVPCSSALHCPEGEVCLADGSCGSCSGPEDCSTEQICNSDGRCDACASSSQCPDSQICNAEGLCGPCSDSSQCPDSGICRDGVCGPECSDASGCSTCQDCSEDGRCEPRPLVNSRFVTTNGNQFRVDGKNFIFAGSNAYYWTFLDNPGDVRNGMQAARDAGFTVFRAWGFHDQNATYDPNGLPKYGNSQKESVLQLWTGDRNVQITLDHLDTLVQSAENAGLKLIITLANNWADYGGMDVYTTNYGFAYHDDFYRQDSIKDAYKNYVRTVVSRYADNPTVLAWELVNEPRCGGDSNRNLPRSTECTPDTITKWIDEMSTYVKSIDSNHLVAVGGEGGFNRASDDYFYNGGDGTDFDAELALPNIDFGTFHTYPEAWGKSRAWAIQWIKDHAEAGRTAGKPVVHEEYGWRDEATREEVLSEWQQTTLDEDMSDLFWQLGWDGYSFGRNDNDGYTVYLDNGEVQPLINHAQEVADLPQRGCSSPDST